MQKLVQIIYISRSTSESTDAINKIEPYVIRILAKSRINNRKNGLVGVLYFGDGTFFQCLEGAEDAVNNLFSKIEKDPRHKDVKLISKKYVSKLSFPDWAMKYAPLDEKMRHFLKTHNYEKFDPYLFSPEITEKILSVLVDAYDPTVEIARGTTSDEILQSATTNNVLNTSNKFTTLSLALSILACMLSIYTIFFASN